MKLTRIVEKIRNNFHSLTDVWLFIGIFFWSTILPIIVKFLSLPRIMEMITPTKTNRYQATNRKSAEEKIIKFTEYILNLDFWIWKSTCLKRSLLLYRFLNKIGVNVQICFGVKYNKSMISKDSASSIDGHAWLCLNGEIFLERNIEMAREYKVTYCFPSL